MAESLKKLRESTLKSQLDAHEKMLDSGLEDAEKKKIEDYIKAIKDELIARK